MRSQVVVTVALLSFCVAGFAQKDTQRKSVKYVARPMEKTDATVNAAAAPASVPMWSATDGTYGYTMIGQSPFTALANPTTTIAAPIIPLVLTFSDGTVFDPTKTSTCNSTSAATLLQSSPIFANSTYTVGGTSVGSTLYHDFFQRANFWKYTNPSGVNPNYHLLLTTSVGTPVNITVPAASGTTESESCGKMGEVEINFLNNYLLSTGFQQLASNGVLPSQIPVFLLSNVVMYETTLTDCCVLGYHSAVANSNYSGATQVYAVTDFDTTGAFGVTTDSSSLSHELAEAINDPMSNNPTPPWGNVGQATGCQTNLEVGDPLSGTDIAITMSNNYTYHVQELAFLSWFYRDSPSIGINGWYSSNDTFKTPSAICNPTTTTLSVSPTSFTVGATATVASAVTPTNGIGTPTGTIKLVSSTGATIGTYSLSAGALNTTTTAFPAGSYTVTADYSGDPNFNASTSTAVSITVGAPSVSFSPIALSFGSQTTGTSSAAQSVRLSNNGTAALTGIAISLAGASPGDYSQTNSCGTTLATGSSCTISAIFKPTATGSRTATVSVADNATGSPQTVPLSGTGAVPAPKVSLSATSINFGSSKVTVPTAAYVVTLTNTGTAALSVSSVALAGTNSTDFTETNTCSGSIVINGTCTVTVTFDPTTIGGRSASVAIADSATGSPQSIALSGTGLSPVTLSATSLAFGSASIGSSSAAQTLTLTNSGTRAISITSVALAGTNPGDFPDTSTCTGSVAANGTCTVAITFKPTGTGTRTATLSITDSAAGSPQSVTLSGTGLTPVTLSATSLVFGSVAVGSASAAQTLTIANSGNAALAIGSLAITGTNPGDFTQTTTCSTSIAAGGSCAVMATFTPAALGGRSAAITFTAGATAESVKLSGSGTAPVTLSATTLAMGSVIVGSPSATKTLTITNAGTSPLTLGTLAITGTNAADFSNTNTCSTSIAAAGNCTVTVTFTPSATGARSAATTFTAAGLAESVALTGSGASPVTLSATSLAFGSVKTGTASAAQTLTIANAGTIALSITSLAITGARAADFTNTTTCGATLAAGAKCTATLTFTPAAKGSATATLSIGDSAIGSPQTVTLTGTGR